MRRLLPLVFAVGLTWVFWSGLWAGGGLIGGDLYPYFFPQKVFYAEQLAENRVPLWNDRVGFGYPVLGESQTGALYPPNLLLYRVFGVNAAYNASQIGHYVAAFLAAYAFLTATGVRRDCSLFGAGAYVYSWFPSRICLEWAAVGAPYLPLGLLLIERHAATGSRRWLGLLSAALACHLLAGHYNLAFIECVVWAVYALFGVRRGESPRFDIRRSSFVVLSLALGFGLASPQLLDTFALKRASQRADVGETFSPGYGHIPPAYLTQVAASHWWSAEPAALDAAIQRLTPAVAADTNKVEAHFYFGIVPLGLALLQVIRAVRSGGDRRQWTLFGLAAYATVYATGVLVPWASRLPGFGYFMGPGRWGIVVALAIAYLAARTLQRIAGDLDRKRGGAAAPLLLGLLAAVTAGDLFLASRRVTYAFVVPQPPVEYLEYSPVKGYFDGLPRTDGPPRVYGPGQNVLSLLGVAQWPTYLGLGPAAYWDAMPPRPEGSEAAFYSDEQVAWLRDHAVGYALTFEPADASRRGLTRVWSGEDPVLNGIWGRGGQPLFLYRINGAARNVFVAEGHCDESDAAVTDVDWRAGRVSASTDASTLHVRQARLSYGLLDGWTGNSMVFCPDDPFSVGVSTDAPGRKTLTYRPGYWHVSLPLSLLAVAAVGWLLWPKRRRPVSRAGGGA